MINILLSAFLIFVFFILPILIVLFFIISLFQFYSEKIKSKRESVSEERLRNLKVRLIVAYVLMAMLVVISAAIMVLLAGAIAFM